MQPQLTRRLIESAVVGGRWSGVGWVADDEAYDGDPNLALALRGHLAVAAVSETEPRPATTPDGPAPSPKMPP
jgi:hypothetical protein